jgi:hypothetical protein
MEKLLEISLPQGSELENVTLDGMNIKLQLVGNKLSVPLKVGQRSLFVSWKSPWEESFIWPVKKMPEVKLNSELSNINVTVNIGEKEWVWAAFGPKWGPASLFWGKLIVILIIAFILGRTNFTPLRIRDWILLSLGLSTLPSLLIAIPVAWFVLLEFKKKKAASYPEQFNLMQVGIVILTFASFAVFYEAVRLGLIFSPEMMITGNNSSASTLRWYLDISNGDIPTPTIISFPIWVWRIVMLAWASWLSFKLLTWLRFGWSAFSEGGLWKKKVAG